MSFLDNMLGKLTDVYKKSKTSNIGKLFSIVSEPMDDLQKTLETMEDWRDIDKAKGAVLDRLGEEILQEYRGGLSDEEYRLKIKTRIIINFLSDGDIETIIKLLEVFLGDHLVSVQTAANVKTGPFAGHPATLLVTMRGHDTLGIPFEELARVLIGGVGTQWEYLLERGMTIEREYEKWMYPFEYYAGELVACGEKIGNDNQLYSSTLNLSGSYSTQLNDYLICGDYVSGNNDNSSYSSDLNIYQSYSKNMQPYPICGTFVAGEVI
ncbi:hypothetical protein P4V34_28555 [Bacillus thuringiensis]|nr:hypothetical protein [Bacillus thuringiensis]